MSAKAVPAPGIATGLHTAAADGADDGIGDGVVAADGVAADGVVVVVADGAVEAIGTLGAVDGTAAAQDASTSAPATRQTVGTSRNLFVMSGDATPDAGSSPAASG
jgi:hypothetical protein